MNQREKILEITDRAITGSYWRRCYEDPPPRGVYVVKDQERRTMNTDNTQDGAEPSLASAGSVANSQATLDGWIPVTERLPEVGSSVLVVEQGEPEQFVGWVNDGKWYCSATNHRLRVTHWMPLPAPPADGK